MNGSELLARCLEVAGSHTVFGVPGTQNTGLFEGLRKANLRTILATHELGAAFQANGYARVSGNPGIVMTIPGPGFLFALPGIVEARHDSAPLVMFVPRAHEVPGKSFQLQVLDQAAFASGAFKETLTIERTEDIPGGVFGALESSLSGEPGPVLVELLDSALRGEGMKPAEIPDPPELQNQERHPPDLAAVLDRVLGGERVLLLLGQGAFGAADPLLLLTEKLGSVVVTNSSGRGVIPEDHPRAVCGDFSGWGTGLVNALVREADLVLAMGYKFSGNGSAGFSLQLPREKLVHVDTSAQVLNANYPSHLSLQMDARAFSQALLEAVEASGAEREGWKTDEVRAWKESFARERGSGLDRYPRLPSGREDELVGFFRSLESRLPQDAIVVTDTGSHQTVVRRLHQVNSPRGLIIPSDFQSMAFGVPAAIGAALAAPRRRVVLVTGDGGMVMAGMELLSAVREGLTLTAIVFNDGYLGQIRAQQIADYGHPHATELGTVDFQALADTVGADYAVWDGSDPGFPERVLDHEGVRVVDLRLTDSPSMRRLRRKALARNAVRRTVGERGVSWLKRWVRRLSSWRQD